MQHICLVSPNIPPDEIFGSFSDFWAHFTPIITQNPEMLRYFSQGERIMVSLICQPEECDDMLSTIWRIRSKQATTMDLIIFKGDDFLNRMLSRRISRDLPIGSQVNS